MSSAEAFNEFALLWRETTSVLVILAAILGNIYSQASAQLL